MNVVWSISTILIDLVLTLLYLVILSIGNRTISLLSNTRLCMF